MCIRDSSSALQIATDWFAPAQWEVLGRAEKLERSSYEEMDAGVVLGDNEITTTAFVDRLGRQATLAYEESLWEDADPVIFTDPPDMLRRAALSGTASRALAERESFSAGEFSISAAQFVVIEDETGVSATEISHVGTGITQSAAAALITDQSMRVVSAASLQLEL